MSRPLTAFEKIVQKCARRIRERRRSRAFMRQRKLLMQLKAGNRIVFNPTQERFEWTKPT